MVNDLGSKLFSMFVLHQQFNLLFAGSGATMAGVASPPPTSTSAQPIPTNTSGQTLPHLPPFRVHFDHLTSSPYHPRITPQERTYDPLIVQKSLTNILYRVNRRRWRLRYHLLSIWLKGGHLSFKFSYSFRQFVVTRNSWLFLTINPPCRPRIRVEKDVEARNSSKDMMVIDGEEPQKI